MVPVVNVDLRGAVDAEAEEDEDAGEGRHLHRQFEHPLGHEAVDEDFAGVALAALVRLPLGRLCLRAPRPLTRVDPPLVEHDAPGKERHGEDVQHEDAHGAEEAEGAQDGQALQVQVTSCRDYGQTRWKPSNGLAAEATGHN